MPPFHWDLVSIWIIIAADQVLRCAITIIFIKHKKVLQSVELLDERRKLPGALSSEAAAGE